MLEKRIQRQMLLQKLGQLLRAGLSFSVTETLSVSVHVPIYSTSSTKPMFLQIIPNAKGTAGYDLKIFCTAAA